jgi:hypothetical protein
VENFRENIRGNFRGKFSWNEQNIPTSIKKSKTSSHSVISPPLMNSQPKQRGVKRKRGYNKPAPKLTKNWRMTVHSGHNPEMCTEENWKKWLEQKWSDNRSEISYIMGGWEKGALTGVLHIQGWVQFKTRKRLVKQKKGQKCVRKKPEKKCRSLFFVERGVEDYSRCRR